MIISISALVAAGFAIYEIPEVRQWIEESRRRVAIALHSLGDEIGPHQPSQSRSPDASYYEDNGHEAIERRRRARQEILARGRMMEERRRFKQAGNAKAKSFDDLVDETGSLREEQGTGATSAADARDEVGGLRKRNVEATGAAVGSAFANPFADEMHAEIEFTEPASMSDEELAHKLHEQLNKPGFNGDWQSLTVPFISADEELARRVQEEWNNEEKPQESSGGPIPISVGASRESTATLPASPSLQPVSPLSQPTSLATPQPERQRLLIDTEEISNHPSEQLLDLTPTTSASSPHPDLSALDHQQRSVYGSIQEWAENHSASSFNSPPESIAADQKPESGNTSQVGDEDEESELGELVHTPSSWTDVGSVISEDH